MTTKTPAKRDGIVPVSARNIDIDELKAVLDPESVLEFIGYEHSSPNPGAEIRDYCPILGCRQERKKGSVGALLINANTHVFYCHKCSAKGSLIDLYMQAIGCSFQEALQQLADRFLFNSILPCKATPRPLLKKETVVIDLPPVNNHSLWVNATEEGDHPYLQRKKVKACSGIRFGKDQNKPIPNDAIVVPFYTVDGDIKTLQFINNNKTLTPPLNDKFFLSGYKGAFFPIGEIKNGEEVYIAEGLATSLTIHEALEGAVTVISAGSAGNIPSVVEAIRGKRPNVKIKLALDANEAARKNTVKIPPPFTYVEPNTEGLAIPEGAEVKDFNDLVSVCGLSLDAVRKQLIENEKRKEGEMATDQKEKTFEISFISDRPINYLIDEVPKIPRLVNFIENGEQKPFIRRGIVAELVAGGGTGKTHALCSLAISVATGTNWLGIYPIEAKGNVFMMLGENGDDDIHRLFRKTTKSLTTHLNNEAIESLLLEASKRLSVMSAHGIDATMVRKDESTDFFKQLKDELIRKEPEDGWSLIIFDPLSRFMGSDAETDNAAATKFISLIEEIILSLKGNPTIMLAHHMNKSSMSGGQSDQGAARGSSAITDGVRWQANLELVFEGKEESRVLNPNQVVFRNVKSNFTKILPPQVLVKDDNGCLRVHEQITIK